MAAPSFQVYIPTRGRLGIMRQPTLREFMAYSDHKPVLVCPEDEEKEHKRQWKDVWACPKLGIGPTRQWILENAKEDIICMVSDDMRFSVRPDPLSPELVRCEDLRPLIALICWCATEAGFIHGGVGPRQGNNHKDFSTPRKGELVACGRLGKHVFTDHERVNDFHWCRPRDVLACGARYDMLPLMEDFYFTLTLLTQGKGNRVIHDYVWNQEASGKTGGCSLYRTHQMQSEAALTLKKAFPEYVLLLGKRSKDSSTSWDGLKARTDVRLYTHEAYLDAVKRIEEEERVRALRAKNKVRRGG